MSSAALPKVALSSPPAAAPSRSASASVALPMYPASGMMPSPAPTKTHTGDAPANFSATATGTARNITLSGVSRRNPDPSAAWADGPGLAAGGLAMCDPAVAGSGYSCRRASIGSSRAARRAG